MYSESTGINPEVTFHSSDSKQRVWISHKCLPNLSEHSIISVPEFFFVAFRPISYERNAFLLMKRKICLLSTSELVWVIIGLLLCPLLLNYASF